MAGAEMSGGRSRLEEATRLLERVVSECDPELLDADAALAYLALFARACKVAEAGEALVARRIDACGAYRRSGHQSAAHLVAATAGVALDRATTTVEVGRRLREQPTTDEAFRRGALSLDQAGLVSAAAAVAPEEEERLVQVASQETVRTLRERSRAVRAAAEADRVARYVGQRAARTFRHGVDDDGMVWGHFRLPPDSGAAVVNRIEREADRCYRAADGDRRREPHDRHAADGLVALITGAAGAATGGPGAELVVHVSRDALMRGSVASGELCRVEGVGDVPVEVAHRLLDDAFLKGVLVDGTCVERVRHFGRRPAAVVRTALRVNAVLQDGTVRCAADGCDRTAGIEWDHIDPHGQGGPTEIANLQALCRHHHRLKTADQNTSRQKTAGRLARAP